MSKPGDILFCWINTVIFWVWVWLDNKTCFVLGYQCHHLVNLCHCALRTKPNLELFLSFSVTLLWLDTPAYKAATCMPVPSHYFQHRSTHSLFSFPPERPAEKAFHRKLFSQGRLDTGMLWVVPLGVQSSVYERKVLKWAENPKHKSLSLRHHVFLGISECRLQRDPCSPRELIPGPSVRPSVKWFLVENSFPLLCPVLTCRKGKQHVLLSRISAHGLSKTLKASFERKPLPHRWTLGTLY